MNHLIRKRLGGVFPTPSQLNFELNLRNYKSVTGFKGDEPWIYPKTKKMQAVITDKSFFPEIPMFTKKSLKDEDDHAH